MMQSRVLTGLLLTRFTWQIVEAVCANVLTMANAASVPLYLAGLAPTCDRTDCIRTADRLLENAASVDECMSHCDKTRINNQSLVDRDCCLYDETAESKPVVAIVLPCFIPPRVPPKVSLL